MLLAEHLTALRSLVHATSAWSVKTRRAPSQHRTDARVYGRTTTAMHDIEYTPPIPLRSGRKGGCFFFCTLLRHGGAVYPNNVPEKEPKRCPWYALCMGCGRHATV